MLFEVRCPGCDRLGWCPCQDCIAALSLVPRGSVGPVVTPVVTPVVGPAGGSAQIDGSASTTSLFWHHGVAREFVHALKFRRERSIARWLGDALAANAPPEIEAVTWPPTTTERRRQRGFDQAQVLAKQVALRLGVPALKLLVRPSGVSQSGLGRAQRLVGPTFDLLTPVRPSRVLPRSILLVDDVLTTGATLRAAIAVIKSGYPVSVHAASCTQAHALNNLKNSHLARPNAGVASSPWE